ncbi:hypothetical protein CONPUDRAFT_161019 [Coniophora puteana RWD-64-598 SS2]|uniref:DUF6533 domain-containing protein n=1 Tax=Coniophora puteana (strain RWD-64-598) TaxID=741705 RepID=A0A5M3N4J1_CONPW|nr:uncharacterized protein CONPUDRAFT_161019 [Coniophora puteana RWD-64-598 SS2]EIW86216.1 hypothetical protein CONPUDRAFT_161019 [Coniophora puteana RWD-64-598 SS2]
MSASFDIAHVEQWKASFYSLNAIYICTLAIWVYDYILTLDDEVVYMRKARFRLAKSFYVVARYMTFPMLGLHLFYNSFSGDTPSLCQKLVTPATVLSTSVVLGSESLFIMRVYALWERNKRILVLIVTSLVLVILATILVTFQPPTSVVNFFLASHQYAYVALFYNLQVVLQALLVTRMHRMLWLNEDQCNWRPGPTFTITVADVENSSLWDD